MSAYNDDYNPYKFWHMQRAFRLGWEAAEDGLAVVPGDVPNAVAGWSVAER